MQAPDVKQLLAALEALSVQELLDIPGRYCTEECSEPTTAHLEHCSAPHGSASTVQASILQPEGHMPPISSSLPAAKEPQDSILGDEGLLHLLQEHPARPQPADFKVQPDATPLHLSLSLRHSSSQVFTPGRDKKHRGRGVGWLTRPVAMQARWKERLSLLQRRKRCACT